jgi:hypothetical protein
VMPVLPLVLVSSAVPVEATPDRRPEGDGRPEMTGTPAEDHSRNADYCPTRAKTRRCSDRH